MPLSAERLYNDLWALPRPGFDERLSTSLNPRAPQMLLERFAALGIGRDDTVLDVGSRDATHAVQFAQRFGCTVIALDPMEHHQTLAQAAIEGAQVAGRVRLVRAPMERMPLESGSVDYLWCRDVFNHVDLPAGLTQCFRVLRPGASLLCYQNFATDAMEPREAQRLYDALAIRPQNMERAYFEQAAAMAGFEIVQAEPIHSEWRERGMEEGWGSLDGPLLRLCRMRRQEAQLVEQYGREFFDASYGADQWLVYQALGKLCPVLHLLVKPVAAPE